MNTELMAAIEALEKEKNISAETLFKGIEGALMRACESYYGKSANVRVDLDRETCDYHIYAIKTVVETPDDVMDPAIEIAAEEAAKLSLDATPGAEVEIEINSDSFGRIAAQNAKSVIVQTIREEEKNAILDYFGDKQRTIMTGVVQRSMGRNISINLGRGDGLLTEKEQVPGERLRPQDRVKVYILEVKNTNKGPRILVSRTHPELVRQLFEEEVTEIRDGIVEIMSIAREPGSRTKIAVATTDPNVDPVGACVGMNGTRVNNIVDELKGEKIDIVNWDENPGNFIQNALSPAKITAVFADPEEKTAKVVVPDYQLSLAIGKEGQNARLAARLTGYKVDIKSETQAQDAVGFRYSDYFDEEEYEEGEYEEGEYEEGAYEEGAYEESEYEEGAYEQAEDPAAEEGSADMEADSYGEDSVAADEENA